MGIVSPFLPEGFGESKKVEGRFKGITSPFLPTEEEAEAVPIGETLGARVTAGLVTIPKIIGEAAEVLSDITGLPHGTLGAEMRKTQEFWRGKAGKDRTSRILGDAVETIISVGSAFALGAISKIKPLVTLSAGAGVDKTSEALREGQPALNAYGAGFVSAATEYYTEKIPLNILGDPALGFFTRLAGGVISDVPGELVATAMELSVIDKQILGRDHHLSTEEYVNLLLDTAAVSAVSVVGLSGASQSVQRLRGEGPSKELPAGISALQDAIRGLQPIPPAENVEKVETSHQSEVDQATRDNSKSEFIGLQGEANPTGPRQELDLTPLTDDAPTPFTEPEVEVDVSDNTSVDAIYDEVNAFKKDKGSLRTKAKKLKDSLVRGIPDVTGNLKAELFKFGNDGKRVVIHRDLMAGSGAKAADDFSIAEREIFSGLTKNQKIMFDKANFARRNLAIRAEKGAKFTFPNNSTEQKMRDFLDRIPAKDKAQIEERQTKWKNAMKFYIDLSVTEGLLTQQQADRLNSTEFYSPRAVLEYLDPIIQKTDGTGKVISVRDSGLKELSEDGSDKLVEMDSQLLLQQVIARTYNRVFKNRAAQAMETFARINYANPDTQRRRDELIRLDKIVDSTSNVFEIIDRRTGQVLTEEAFETKKEAERVIEGDEDIYEVQKVKIGKPIYEGPDSDERLIFSMKDGKATRMIMPKEMANEWVLRDPILSSQMSNWIGWLSGNKILKAMATGLNPEFAITNIPRDMAHIYLTTEEYSSFAPKFIYQMMQDIKEVANDAELKKGLYRKYIDLGGGMAFLSTQFREKQIIPGLSTGMSKAADIMGYMGERSELLTRLALMNRAIKNKKSDQEAVWIARNYLDFSQGGSVIKALDTGIPYLNASVQATRGIVRAAKNNPKTFGIKMGQIGLTAMSLFLANSFNKDPETGKSVYDDVPERDKVGNWIITTPLWFKDKDGTKRYYYMKIPKDQGQRVVATAFESLLKKQMGLPVDEEAIVDSILDFFPILPTDTLPPVVDATLGYMVNKDFWRREDIWKGDPVTPSEEFNKYTPEVYKQFGAVTGLSPERFKYGVEQYFTSGNIWTSIVGWGAKQSLDELNEADMKKTVEELFLRKPGVRRFLKSTRPEVEQRRRVKEAKIEANTQRKRLNTAFDELTERFYNKRTDINEVKEFLKRQPSHEISRLRKRFQRAGKLKDIPNRRYWLNLSGLPPEYRAINYWNDWQQQDAAGRVLMDQTSAKVPGFRSDRFNRQFNKMKEFGQGGATK